MKTHKLKVKKDYLDNMLNSSKKASVRLNDRDYQVGDIVEEYNIDKLGSAQKILSYMRPDCCYKISHIHSGLGMADNYVVLSFKKLILGRN